ncbi:unnamed protein product [Moneuplotes crassus]|uniref:Peptide deformylase n=1 Tax=Euplotes crassus TaxID=5936 RepID=A0AAD1XNB2_EUPCR|nr:unnamed protein product [Moneuplotes crassus]
MQVQIPAYKMDKISKIAVFGTMEQGTLLGSPLPFPDFTQNRANIVSEGFPKGVMTIFDLIKKTAVNNKLTGVSAPQVDMEETFFLLHKEIMENNYTSELEERNQFYPEEYEVVINPFIEYETVDNTEDYEYSASFPQFQSVIARPDKISVHYTDENMDRATASLSGLNARHFLSHWDMMMGESIIWWYRNHGRISVKDELREDFPHLIQMCEKYYNQRVGEFIKDFPEFLEEFRPHGLVTKDGVQLRQFYPDTDIHECLDNNYYYGRKPRACLHQSYQEGS